MARRIALGIGIFSMALLGADALLVSFDVPAFNPPPEGIFDAQTPWILNGAICGAFGLLIAYRRPRHAIGWLLLAISLTDAVNVAAILATMRAQLSGAPANGWVQWSAWLGNWMGGAGAGFVVLLLFLFPDGRLPGPRWRPALWAVIAFGLIFLFGSMFNPSPVQETSRLAPVPNPVGVAGVSTAASNAVQTAVIIPTFGVVIAAIAVRYRRSRGNERSQLRAFAFVVAVGLSLTIAGFLVGLFNSGLGNNLSAVFFDALIGVAMPAVIGIAVLRQGLYDIDVLISRSLAYASLVTFATAVYVGLAVGVGALLGGGGRPNLALSILATAIVAIAFQPLRDRLQKLANRVVFGRRATPYDVLAEFSARASEAYAADEVLTRMVQVLGEGTGAERAEVWLRSGARLHRAAAWPDAPAAEPLALELGDEPAIPGRTRVVAVRHQRDLLGALAVTKRREEPLTTIEEKLLTDLANQAGLLLRNVHLTADLQSRLEELRLSRQRLVAAQDQERRRIERDLHDGAQQHLVALQVKLGLAEELLERDPERASAALAELRGDADEALKTLRDLAGGIYPPLLAAAGLGPALQAHARKATVDVRVDADGVGRHAEAIEAAVYFCVLEALQNVQKYSDARSATVRLRQEDGEIAFEVADDGRGFNPETTPRGSGLTNMADRLDALGGRLEMIAAPGRGVRVQGRVPV